MKFEIKFPDLEEANEFANRLKDENLRGVKVSQAEKEPEDGSLDMAELLPWISLVVSSPFVKTVALKLIDYLQERMKAKNEKEIKLAENETNKEIELKKLESREKYIEFNIENNGKKLNFKLSKNDDAQYEKILEAVNSIVKE